MPLRAILGQFTFNLLAPVVMFPFKCHHHHQPLEVEVCHLKVEAIWSSWESSKQVESSFGSTTLVSRFKIDRRGNDLRRTRPNLEAAFMTMEWWDNSLSKYLFYLSNVQIDGSQSEWLADVMVSDTIQISASTASEIFWTMQNSAKTLHFEHHER